MEIFTNFVDYIFNISTTYWICWNNWLDSFKEIQILHKL